MDKKNFFHFLRLQIFMTDQKHNMIKEIQCASSHPRIQIATLALKFQIAFSIYLIIPFPFKHHEAPVEENVSFDLL